jgi:hypothetical protein
LIAAPPTVPRPPEPALDPEALIEEARARQRRRRRRWGAIVVVAAIVSGALAAAFWPRGSAGLQHIGRAGPSVNLAAMRNHGELAFVSRDDLYLANGSERTVHRIAVQPGWTALHPSFSSDGRWLVYETEDQSDSSSDVWLARADGTDRRRIVGADGVYGWSPSADSLAISTHAATRLELVSPTGARKRLVASTGYRVWNAVWSPSGDAVAVSLVSWTRGSIVRSYPVDGDHPTTWFAIDSKQALPGVCTGCGGGGTIADLAGWWPKWGIGFWVFSSGAVHNNDSTPIELVRAPGATPHIIGWTLSDRVTDAVAASSSGALAIVASTQSAGRDYGVGKQIATCNLAKEACTPIGTPASAVSLDPVWSPTENLLAYVRAPTARNENNPAAAWYRAHKLYVYDPTIHRSTEIAGIDGVSVPTWSSDGKSLLYVAGDALWLAPAAGGKPTELAAPLFAPAKLVHPGLDLNSYYGQIDWNGQFAWRSP